MFFKRNIKMIRIKSNAKNGIFLKTIQMISAKMMVMMAVVDTNQVISFIKIYIEKNKNIQ
jgi:hypothetical protein